MRILVCNERFLFRFGVDRCLLMLGNQWRKDGHEIIMMGNRMDPASVSKCSDRFIRIPDAPGEVAYRLRANEIHARHSEGSFIRLKDGMISSMRVNLSPMHAEDLSW